MKKDDAYEISAGEGWWRLFCLIFGHDFYRMRGWYFIEWGCHRCKMKFLHQYDLHNKPLYKRHDDISRPLDKGRGPQYDGEKP